MSCPKDGPCELSAGTDNTASPAGEGAGVAPEGSGPGARLRYTAGGVGHPGFPGTAAWTPSLGRYWSHDYAERVIVDPDESHAWLITKFGTFREFSDLEAAGPLERAYEATSPSNEYRTLVYIDDTPTGWELRGLDGTIQHFDEDGLWTSTIDRTGENETIATYTSGVLTGVAFPDGRSEAFSYYEAPDPAEGKLHQITEVGVLGADSRSWTYHWDGDDLTAIDRPDGTSWEFTYGDGSHPGYLTLMELVGTSAGRRVTGGWEYDGDGNVTTTWKGTLDPDDPDVLDKWTLAYDAPALPTETTVTDPLGQVTVYAVDREPGSFVARVTSVSGSCPLCSVGPDTTFEYGDEDHPLLPTATEDANGVRTEYAYDANGQMTARIEAFGETEARTTFRRYDTTYPSFPTLVRQLSTTTTASCGELDAACDSGSQCRDVSTVYDPLGNTDSRSACGFEDGTFFEHETAFTYATSGEPLTIDPPGYSTDDVTEYDYDPTRGDLYPLTRTDPIVGDTTFGYDPFNRRTGVIDPNLVETTTEYDDLDRVTLVTQLGATAPDDLVTEYEHNEFGDLERTTLPEGNVIEYGYDDAGRLTSIERKASAAAAGGDRTSWQLDEAGNRVSEKLERWDSPLGDYVLESETSYQYSTSCRLDKVIRAPGTAEEAVTEYGYDCNGNLERVWDANHDSAGQTNPATQLYAYDTLNRLTSVAQPEGGSSVTSYEYDVQDHLISVTDAEGNETTYEYSDRDLLTEQVSPVSGTTAYTYNEHGELVTETDARSVTVTRTVDALDRVELVSYPDSDLDVDYVYDDPGVDFSLGRLTAIERNAKTIDYEYDRFGRVTRDGDLTHTYDRNGNRTTVTYPTGFTASYAYDFADRQGTLSVSDGGTPQSIVTASAYLPSGPLTSLELGNGLVETRGFDGRYFPASIEVEASGDPRSWIYTTDNVGNIEAIEQTVDCTTSRLIDAETLDTDQTLTACEDITVGSGTEVLAPAVVTLRAGEQVVIETDFSVEAGASFTVAIDPSLGMADTISFAYQDIDYFLTEADGPWGERIWTYDSIGNRLSETRDAVLDEYAYVAGTSGNSPILDIVDLDTTGLGGQREYSFGLAGHLETVVIGSGASQIDFTTGDDGRLSEVARSFEIESEPQSDAATFAYDGRSFLCRVENVLAGSEDVEYVEPVYSSEGLLHGLTRVEFVPVGEEGETEERTTDFSIFYFAGRPVAQVKELDSTTEWMFLTTDHLGTPLLATNLSGDDHWAGPFEPFGKDYFQQAQSSDVLLRLPGQWDDPIWQNPTAGAGIYYNVHRWYEYGAGRYLRPDPLGIDGGDSRLYGYARLNPLSFIDTSGLKSRVCCRPLKGKLGRTGKTHCYIEIETGKGNTTCGLYRIDGVGEIKPDHPDDNGGECGGWNPECSADECAIRVARNYPNPSEYSEVGVLVGLGANSNTFASEIANTCGLKPPGLVGEGEAPGWGNPPPYREPGREPKAVECALP
jgi:RHS repeat-associated protein